jgi:2'-5' RNA ligase
VTLVFIGSVDSERLPLIDALGRDVAIPPFELQLDQPGYWRRSRIAWQGASTVPIALTAQVDRLRQNLGAAGVAFDAKRHMPHVTLARDAARIEPLPQLTPVRWPAASFGLVQSSGGHYTVLSEYALG